MKTILVVEDDKKINQLIADSLTIVGYHCYQALFGMEALTLLQTKKIDVVILDVQLPDIDGFTLIKSINTIPVLFLTARDSVEDRVKGLTLGAEDYLVKPFAIDELLARVHVIIRRTQLTEIFYLEDLKVSLLNKQVYLAEQLVELTPQEFSLLEVFILNKNIALSREQLLAQAWQLDYEGEERTVDVHVQRLRKKLALENNLQTVFKVGYRLDVD